MSERAQRERHAPAFGIDEVRVQMQEEKKKLLLLLFFSFFTRNIIVPEQNGASSVNPAMERSCV